MCLPLGFGISPKRDLSAFSNIADTGAFIRVGIVLIVLGLTAFLLSHFVPSDEIDE